MFRSVAELLPEFHDLSVRFITSIVVFGQLCVRYPPCARPDFVNDLIDEAHFRDRLRRIQIA